MSPPPDPIAASANAGGGWARESEAASLPEANRTIAVPRDASFWRKCLAFAGPGFLVAVGYMDPGNWATDLAGGSKFGYSLLFVIGLSNCMAILLQHLAVKLGIATGRDLAQACRDHYSPPVVWFLWIMCEVAIAACDLAEVVGSAIALQLLFGLPLIWGCVITALDVLIVLLLQQRGFRYLEAVVITLIATIGTCFAVELFIAKPAVGAVLGHVPLGRAGGGGRGKGQGDRSEEPHRSAVYGLHGPVGRRMHVEAAVAEPRSRQRRERAEVSQRGGVCVRLGEDVRRAVRHGLAGGWFSEGAPR